MGTPSTTVLQGELLLQLLRSTGLPAAPFSLEQGLLLYLRTSRRGDNCRTSPLSCEESIACRLSCEESIACRMSIITEPLLCHVRKASHVASFSGQSPSRTEERPSTPAPRNKRDFSAISELLWNLFSNASGRCLYPA